MGTVRVIIAKVGLDGHDRGRLGDATVPTLTSP